MKDAALVEGEIKGKIVPKSGEFRNDAGKAELIPAFAVDTDNGLATIPVDQLIPFKKKTEEPSPAK